MEGQWDVGASRSAQPTAPEDGETAPRSAVNANHARVFPGHNSLHSPKARLLGSMSEMFLNFKSKFKFRAEMYISLILG